MVKYILTCFADFLGERSKVIAGNALSVDMRFTDFCNEKQKILSVVEKTFPR
jgi:hypothetical protein